MVVRPGDNAISIQNFFPDSRIFAALRYNPDKCVNYYRLSVRILICGHIRTIKHGNRSGALFEGDSYCNLMVTGIKPDCEIINNNSFSVNGIAAIRVISAHPGAKCPVHLF